MRSIAVKYICGKGVCLFLWLFNVVTALNYNWNTAVEVKLSLEYIKYII